MREVVSEDDVVIKSDKLVCLAVFCLSLATVVEVLVFKEGDPFLDERFSRILFNRSLKEPITIPFDRGEPVTLGLVDNEEGRGGVAGVNVRSSTVDSAVSS